MLTRFRCFFLWLWVNHFCWYWMHFTTLLNLVILGQISAAFSESWYWKLEFRVTSFWFYYHRLWWSSWRGMLTLYLLLVFLVWISSWHELFQVTRTDASCAIYIICSQFMTFEQVPLYPDYCAWLIAFLISPSAFLPCTCPYLFSVVLVPVIEGNCFYIISILYLSGAGLTCPMLACRLLGLLVCLTRRLYT